MNRYKNKFLVFILLALFTFSASFAGDLDRVGTDSGVQTVIPVGSRGLSMAGADIATTRGVESIYWNPAGMAALDGGEALFSTRNMLADINLNYFAVGYGVGDNTFGFSIKAFDFGEILRTTVDHQDGTGATFSPTFSTISLVYGRKVTDRIHFGARPKVIYENIDRATATAFAADFGLQYANLLDINGLALGIFVKNIGTDMKYDGSAFTTYSQDQVDESPTAHNEFRKIETESHKLPTSINMGLTYTRGMNFGNLTVAGTYQRNNYMKDDIRLGLELAIADMIFVRTGNNFYIGEVDNDALADEEDNDAVDDNYGSSDYQFTIGAGIKYNLMGAPLKFGYNYMPGNYFDASHAFTIGVGF